MLNVTKLRNDVNKKLDNWNERSQFTLSGVKNLSLSDMETLLYFCDIYEVSKTLGGIIINNDMRTILKKYGWKGE